MYRKFIELLTLITEEILDEESDVEEAIRQIRERDINLFRVNDDLKALENSSLIGDEEADAVRSVLVFLFARETDMDIEEIYALVFGGGKKLTWH